MREVALDRWFVRWSLVLFWFEGRSLQLAAKSRLKSLPARFWLAAIIAPSKITMGDMWRSI